MKRIVAICVLLMVVLTGCSKGERPPVEKGRIGVLTGSTADSFMTENYKQADIKRFDNINDAVIAIQGNKLDYICTSYTTCLNFVRANDDLTFIDEVVIDEGVAIAIAKESTELFQKVSDQLEAFRADGTLDKAISNWINDDGSDYIREDIPTSTSGKVLKVGVAANREPMCFIENGEYAGLDIELIKRIAYSLDMEVEFLDMQFSMLVTALQSGKVDLVISNLTPTEERAKKVDFTEIYFDNPQVLLVKKDK